MTAHGITDALRDAQLLATAVLSDTEKALERYQLKRDALSDHFFTVTDRIASFEWDVTAIKAHHRALNHAMKLEIDALFGSAEMAA